MQTLTDYLTCVTPYNIVMVTWAVSKSSLLPREFVFNVKTWNLLLLDFFFKFLNVSNQLMLVSVTITMISPDNQIRILLILCVVKTHI